MRSPSFVGRTPGSEAASASKRRNRSTDTKHEVLLRRALWQRGLRFRKNVTTLPGKPDIVFSRSRVAVFCDGDFWHGRNWRRLSSSLQKRANASYWCDKIRSNMVRDRRTTRLLEEQCWQVIRLWEGDITRDPEGAASLIEAAVLKRVPGEVTT